MTICLANLGNKLFWYTRQDTIRIYL